MLLILGLFESLFLSFFLPSFLLSFPFFLTLPPFTFSFLPTHTKVESSDLPAVEVVIRADKKRLALLEEEAKLTAEIAASTDAKASKEQQQRLNEVG